MGIQLYAVTVCASAFLFALFFFFVIYTCLSNSRCSTLQRLPVGGPANNLGEGTGSRNYQLEMVVCFKSRLKQMWFCQGEQTKTEGDDDDKQHRQRCLGGTNKKKRLSKQRWPPGCLLVIWWVLMCGCAAIACLIVWMDRTLRCDVLVWCLLLL